MISREGPWFKIQTSDGKQGYVSVAQVSREKKRFVGLSLAPTREFDPSTCFVPKVRSDQQGKLPPRVIYSPDPEYDDPQSRKAGLEGTVTLSLTVGADGLTHDVKVDKSLASGLDQRAIEAVQRWKFDPATEDGKPVPVRIHVDVRFRISQ